MSYFLDNLKESLEKGDFNSKSAANINKIAELSESKLGNLEQIKEKLETIQKNLPAVDAATANAASVSYEAEIKKLQDADAALSRLAQAFQMDDDLTQEIAAIDLAKANVIEMVKNILAYIESLTPDLENGGKEFQTSLLEIKDKYEKML